MNGNITIAVIGCGAFAKNFVNLFKNHPYVKKVYVCDIIKQRAEEYSKNFNVEIIDSFEEVLRNKEINAIANFTQRHLHGEITIRSLKNGKHVYSAVPMASTVEECCEIAQLVKETGLTYVIGETCYYFPCAMYCREAFKEGKFGEFAYGAAQYYHHINDISYGQREKERGMPPLLYPTHSTAMIISTLDSYVRKVSCFGCKDTWGDKAFEKENNEWGNEFINQYVMMQLANGGTARVSEARGLGYGRPSSYISGLYGTKGSYEFSNAQHLLIEKDFSGDKENVFLTDVSDYVNPYEMTVNKNIENFKEKVANGFWQQHSFAPVQEKEKNRLPQEYQGLENGHMASHQFLIDDFCKAVYNDKMPELNAWFAARCNIPGLVAIKSAEKGGEVLNVPDCGDAPGYRGER